MNQEVIWQLPSLDGEGFRRAGNKVKGLGRAMAKYACVAGLLVVHSLGQAASFDCAKALTQIEKSICGSPRLSEMDSELGRLYNEALSRTPDAGDARSELRGQQKAWLEGRRNLCSDEVCLEGAYATRLALLGQAKAAYDEAKANAGQEDRNPPPESETPAASSPSSERQSERVQPATQQVASATVALPSQPMASAIGATSKDSSGVGEKLPTIFLVIAFLQVPLTFWMVLRKTKSSKGTGRGLATAGAASSVAFIALATVGFSLTSEEERAKWNANKQNIQSPPDATNAKTENPVVLPKPEPAKIMAADRSGGASPVAEMNRGQASKYCIALTAGIVGVVTDAESGADILAGAQTRARNIQKAFAVDPNVAAYADDIAQKITAIPSQVSQFSELKKKYGEKYSELLLTECMKPSLISESTGRPQPPPPNSATQSLVRESVSVSQRLPGQSIEKSSLSSEDYKRICQETKGATKQAIRVLATVGGHEEQKLLDGGSIDEVRVKWAKSNSGVEACYLLVDASGVVNGTSTRVQAQGIVKTFLVNDNRETLAHFATLF